MYLHGLAVISELPVDNLNSFEMFDHVDKAGSMKRKPTALDQRTERRSNYMDGPPQVQTAAF
eukprot:m.173374 g.173374  ORF g.173374 m.173374 type:complete len:62 (-) comp14585_c0_seq3:380-565(-)